MKQVVEGMQIQDGRSSGRWLNSTSCNNVVDDDDYDNNDDDDDTTINNTTTIDRRILSIHITTRIL